MEYVPEDLERVRGWRRDAENRVVELEGQIEHRKKLEEDLKNTRARQQHWATIEGLLEREIRERADEAMVERVKQRHQK